MKKNSVIVVGSLVFLTQISFLAGSLSAHAEDARVLPAGRSRMSLVYAQSAVVSQSYNNQGQTTSITDPYHIDLSSTNIAKLKPEVSDLVHVLNNSGWHYNEAARGSASHGLTRDAAFPALGDALSRGNLSLDAQATRQQVVAAYLRGITDRLSFGVIVPVLRTQIKANASLTGVNTAADAYAGFAGNKTTTTPNAMVAGLNQLQSLNIDTLQNELTSRGYERIGDSSRMGLGDVVLGARYGYFNPTGNQGRWIHAVQANVSLPTGYTHSASALADVDSGLGTTELGLAHITNFIPVSFWTLSGGLHYNYRFANSRSLRVRTSSADLLPDAASQEEVGQRLGDKISATLGSTFYLTQSVTLEAGYEFAWKGLDRYQGNRGDRDYTYLSDNTEIYTEMLSISAGFSTLPAFLKKEFPVPASFSLSAFIPRRGKNTYVTPYATAELSLYF